MERIEHLYRRNHSHLENKRTDLFPDIFRWDFWNFCLLECWDTSDKVHLVPPADLRFLDDLVTEVHSKEDRDVDV